MIYPITSFGSHVNNKSKHHGLNGGGPRGHLHIGEPPQDIRVLNYDKE